MSTITIYCSSLLLVSLPHIKSATWTGSLWGFEPSKPDTLCPLYGTLAIGPAVPRVIRVPDDARIVRALSDPNGEKLHWTGPKGTKREEYAQAVADLAKVGAEGFAFINAVNRPEPSAEPSSILMIDQHRKGSEVAA
jgi:hypothetical protein